ncbi:protein TolR [Futiania mangrovi]|uniref:Protein TolR n=1 Tax=Futiania mangrovi TaxID=2959716 RepID=A0A9J6P7N4_9PROT|nr:protein TolR [Futiania mangrovii]MCP1334892.1 protein TolR [Futiania mangrovii]
MGASLGTGAGGNGPRKLFGGGRRRMSYRPMAEINVTPFVDVMLVLLIVFMVAAPLLTVGVPVELPKTQARALPFDQEEPLTITVDADGRVFIQETEVPLDGLVAKIAAIRAARDNDRLYIKADRDVDYGKVMVVMGRLNSGGFTKIGLVTEPEPEAGR